jgi:hypothetical protein
MRKLSATFIAALIAALLSATTAVAEDGPRIMEIPTVFEPVLPSSPAALAAPLPVGGSIGLRDGYMLLRQGAH